MTAPVLTRRSDRAALRRERRTITNAKCQYRSDGTDSHIAKFQGYASMTGVPYEVNDWLGTYTETVERGAFGKTLQERDDVRLLLNHEGMPMARTASGTMSLTEDQLGLESLADLDTRMSLTSDVALALERGDLDQMSMAFRVTRQEWNEDYTERFIREVQLYDVSIVTYPASTTTSAKLRGLDVLGELDEAELAEVYARLGKRFATPAVEAEVVAADLDAMKLRARAALAL